MNANIDGYNIEYKITGTGERVVVLLQGWGTDCSVYDVVARTIDKKYTVVQFDMPGFGKSDEPRAAWSVDEYVDFFIKFLEYLDIKKATLWGHSYGGRVIIKLIGREYEGLEIERVVLVDSAGVIAHKTFSQKLKVAKYKFLKKCFGMKLIYNMFPMAIEAWRNKQGSADYRNATPIMRQCLVKAVNEDLSKLFEYNKYDTLLIWGDLDTATPISDARVMEKAMINSGLAVIKGAGHFCFLDKPGVFSRIMKSYFEVED